MRGGQQGQAAIFLILLSFMIAATAALAVDIGVWVRDARHAQNDADSVVLAAVLELPEPGTSSATAVAHDWASKNNVPAEELECCEFEDRDGEGRADTVRAIVHHKSKSLFARLIGFGDPTVHRKGAAMRVRARGASIMPWAVFCDNQADPACGVVSDQLYGFHFGGPTSPGNFNALALDGPGANRYRENIARAGGSQGVYEEGGDVFVLSETGNIGKNTCQALYDRTQSVEGDVPPCGPGGSGSAYCDATSAADAEAKRDICFMRIVPLPITEEFEEGKDELAIFRVGTFYIAGWDRTNPYGSGFDADGDGIHDMVWGYFIPDTAVPADFLLDLDPENPGGNPLAPLAAVLIE